MEQTSRGDGKRVEYLMPPDQETSDILEFKKVCAILLGDLYGLARLGKPDLRGMADFQGKLMTLYQLLRGDMIKSDVKDYILETDEKGIVVTDEKGEAKKIPFLKYQELSKQIDYEFRAGFDMKTGQLILEKLNEFIRESGILKKNLPRYLIG